MSQHLFVIHFGGHGGIQFLCFFFRFLFFHSKEKVLHVKPFRNSLNELRPKNVPDWCLSNRWIPARKLWCWQLEPHLQPTPATPSSTPSFATSLGAVHAIRLPSPHKTIRLSNPFIHWFVMWTWLFNFYWLASSYIIKQHRQEVSPVCNLFQSLAMPLELL